MNKSRILWLISGIFAVWGLGFIYRTSVMGIDGHRYFNLVDDAMISMRYGWNLAHSLGLVWNPGERVEGYSNLLMVLWMAAASLVLDKSNAVLLIQLSGLPLMLGSAWLTMKMARLTLPEEISERRTLIEVLAFAAALAYYPLAFWSLLGMETGLLALLITWAVYASLKYQRTHESKSLVAAAIALGLAYLTRNDSSIFAVIVFAFLLAASRRGRDWRPQEVAPAVAIYAGFVVGQIAFRLLYYGQWLPNTYVLKLTGMPIGERLKNGAGFIGPFLLEISLLFCLCALGTIWRFRAHKVYLIAIFIASVAYQVLVGGDFSDYWRIMAPTVPMLSVVLIQEAAEFFERGGGEAETGSASRRRRTPARWEAGALIAGSVILVMISANVRFLNEVLLPASLGYVSRDYVNLGLAIKAVTEPDATVGVVRAGTIPYYSGRKAIDFLGKSDTYIASLPPDTSGEVSWNGMESVPGHNKYDLNYSIKIRRPTYVEGFEWGSQNLNAWAADYYVEVKYKGLRLDLLRDSPLVHWDLVKFMTKEENPSN
jgi:hypothetical protein